MSGLVLTRYWAETRELPGGLLVDHGTNLSLFKGSAALIWQAIDGRRTRAQVAAHVASLPGSPPEAAADVNEYLDSLIGRELVVEHDGEPQRFTAATGLGRVDTDDGGMVLAHFGSGHRVVLSATSAAVWELAATGCTIAEIVSTLQSEIADAPSALDVEVQRTLAVLSTADLLVAAA